MSDNRNELCRRTDIILHSETTANENHLVRQADSDPKVIALWLHGRSKHTQRAYRSDVQRLLDYVDKPLNYITLGDLQKFADALTETGLQPASRHRIIAAVKSLIVFAHKIGYLPYDVSRPLKSPKFKDGLAERILSEAEVQRIIGMEPNPRNQLLLRLLYAGAIRVSELSRLTWSDLQERNDGGQMIIFGKGGKTNVILIPNPLWHELMTFRNDALETAPVFRSRKGGHLHPSQVLRIVKTAARRAGITKPVSPHWFRHAHCSHAMDHGCPIHIVQATANHSSVATTGRYLHARPNDSSSKYLTV